MLRLRHALVVVGIVLGGCHHQAAPLSDRLALVPPGRVLILPPRDMVQGGGFHEVSPGSGAYLLNEVRPQLERRGWRVMTTDSTSFSNLSIADPREAITEGRRLEADYVMRLVLGEFLDAAPMTFRPDFVTLQSAELWSTKNGALIWSISTPLVYAGANLRHYNRLIDDMAGELAEHLAEARVDASVFTKPVDPALVHAGDQAEPTRSSTASAPPSTPSVHEQQRRRSAAAPCTTDQVLSMKSAGLSDAQVKAACD